MSCSPRSLTAGLSVSANVAGIVAGPLDVGHGRLNERRKADVGLALCRWISQSRLVVDVVGEILLSATLQALISVEASWSSVRASRRCSSVA